MEREFKEMKDGFDFSVIEAIYAKYPERQFRIDVFVSTIVLASEVDGKSGVWGYASWASEKIFTVQGESFTIAQMRDGNADDPDVLAWLEVAEVNDHFYTWFGQPYAKRIA